MVDNMKIYIGEQKSLLTLDYAPLFNESADVILVNLVEHKP
jgi:hypothetical protein